MLRGTKRFNQIVKLKTSVAYEEQMQDPSRDHRYERFMKAAHYTTLSQPYLRTPPPYVGPK